MSIGEGNLRRIVGDLAASVRVIAAGAGSTATQINAPTGATLASGQYDGGILRFLTGALAGQEQIISSNTASAIATGAFTGAPAEGDLCEIISLVQVQAIVSENISNIGGTAQTGADWTPLLQGIATTTAVGATTTAVEATQPRNIAQVNGASAAYSSLLSPNTAIAAPAAVSVGTTAVRLDTGLANRRYITIVNNGTAAIYVGTSAVTTATGIPIAAGASATFNLGPSLPLYGISTATEDTRVMEVA